MYSITNNIYTSSNSVPKKIYIAMTETKPNLSVNQTQLDLPEVWEVYEQQENYEILTSNNEDSQDICIIYFSSHALYYPNNSETFHKRIIQENRYEWKRNILTTAKKVIFVRDVLKQWYIQGINSRINSIEKLYEFLKQEAGELSIICVGNSAGGYAATLFGCLFEAKCVFSFSGFFSIDHCLEEKNRLANPLVVKYENLPEIKKYYSLLDILKNSQVPIFFFYAARAKLDNAQSKLIDNLDNVYAFSFDRSAHGQTCYTVNFLTLFGLETDQLKNIYFKYQGQVIKPLLFSIHVSGYIITLNFVLSRFRKRINLFLQDKFPVKKLK